VSGISNTSYSWKGESLMFDYSYTELNERIIEVFEAPHNKNEITDTLENNYFYAEYEDEPDMFLHHMKVIVYEVKHNILTDRMKAEFIDYSARWDNGEFKDEILPNDIPIIQKDIDYVRSVLKL
jgi:hypothetical protein